VCVVYVRNIGRSHKRRYDNANNPAGGAGAPREDSQNDARIASRVSNSSDDRRS